MQTAEQTNRCSLSFSGTQKGTNTYVTLLAANNKLCLVSFESLSGLMEKIVNLHGLYLRHPPHPTPPFPPVLFPWLTGRQATVRILNERPFLSSQSVSHLGKGDLDGECSLASGFDPRVL